jgi:hypothetical protein
VVVVVLLLPGRLQLWILAAGRLWGIGAALIIGAAPQQLIQLRVRLRERHVFGVQRG